MRLPTVRILGLTGVLFAAAGCDSDPQVAAQRQHEIREQHSGAGGWSGGGSSSGGVDMSLHAKGRPTAQQLQNRLMGFADRYLNRMSESMDAAAAAHPTAACRVASQATKYYPGLTVVTVACDPDPKAALLDMVVVVTLERMVWEGEWAREVFGDQAEQVMAAQREVEADIWSVAASVMSPDQLEELRRLIDAWRAENPHRKYVSSTRFDDFAALRAARRTANFELNLLAPVSDAARAVEEARLLGERSLFLAARMPLLVHWQAELLMYEATARPEVAGLLKDTRDFAEAAKRLTAVAERWPSDLAKQRAELVHELEKQQQSVQEVLATVRENLAAARQLTDEIDEINASTAPMIADSRELVASVREAITLVDRFSTRIEGWAASDPNAPPSSGRGFDILEYRDTAQHLTATLKELNQALSSGDALLDSKAGDALFTRFEEIMNRRITHAGDQARLAVKDLFWAGAGLIGIATAAAVLVVFVRRRLLGRHGEPRMSREGLGVP